MFEDPGLALDPAILGLLDVLGIRSKHVEDEQTAGYKEIVGRREDAAAVLVRLHVQERPEGTDHQRHALRDRRVSQIAEAKIELDACKRCPPRAHVEHAARRVDTDDADSLGCDGDGYPARADTELDDRTA